MGKSSDSRGEVRERVTDANKVPLGRPSFFSGSKPSGASSLLKPSYLSTTGGGGGQHDDSGSNSSSYNNSASNYYSTSSTGGMSLNFANLNQHIAGLSQSSSSSSTSMSASANSLKQAADYSRWSDGSFSGFAQMKSSSSLSSSYNNPIKRENEDSSDSFGAGGGDDERGRKRKRRSRWQGGTDEKAVIPGMPTILPSDLPIEQQEAYIAQLQIEELTRKLRSGDLGIPPNPEDRSPSPEPIYGTDGKRLNTREYRTRKKLEDERHKLIQRLLKLNPDYKPPADYRAPIVKIVDRVPIPQEEHPEINFVGLLIGPRGNTLKGLEKDTGAKIIIRGKGSVKEGKVGGKAGHPLPGEDEPLHAYVTSNNADSVKKACEKIKEIIRQGIDMPESQNDLRKNQLRELALLNGTLREGEGPKCSNCGATSHRTWHCPDKPNVTNSVICTVCGGAGHIGRDCRMKRPGAGGPPTAGGGANSNEKAKIDEEYLSLMAELGEAPPKDDVRSRFGSSKSFSTGGQGLFDKASAPKAIMAPAPPSTTSSAAIAAPPASTATSSVALPPPVIPPPIIPPPPLGGTTATVPATYPPPAWTASQPPPPGDLAKSPTSTSTTAVPPPIIPPPVVPPSTAWSYPSTFAPAAAAMMSTQWSQWAPPVPPVPPPPGSSPNSAAAQPPPPGMYWQQSGGYGITPPPPPPPETTQPPPPPPS